MEILSLAIDKINPSAYNPRKDLKPGDPEYDKLKKSILEFDMVEPLVWNKQSGNLVGGHQRLKILKELGRAKVEVSVVDLDEVKEKALNLALNKIQGEWDFPKLKDILEELDTGEFDMEITGFDPKEIEDLMSQFHVPGEGLTDDDAIPEPTESISRRGDLWSLGNHRLLCGGATVREDVERLMGGEKADMVFTDPPYSSGGYQEAGKSGGSIGARGNKTIMLDNLSTRGYRKLIEDTLNLHIETRILLLFTDWRMWIESFDIAERSGFRVRNMLVWDKVNFGMGSPFRSQHELILFGLKSSGDALSPANKGNVFNVKRAEQKLHFTMKPVELIMEIMGNLEANIILDPFGGSGSTLIACEKLDRRCYMMEISEMYCDIIRTRWEQFTGKKAVRID